MRHRRKGRKLGRHPSHQRALLRSLATALFLTERDAEDDDNKPKVKGRIITTIEKAKEVRSAGRAVHHHRPPRLAAAGSRRPVGAEHRAPQRPVAAMARQRPVERVEPGDRAGGRRPPPRLAAAGRQAGGARSSSTRSPRASPIARAATPACCGWPSRAWATPAPARFSNWSARTTASARRPPSRRSTPTCRNRQARALRLPRKRSEPDRRVV